VVRLVGERDGVAATPLHLPPRIGIVPGARLGVERRGLGACLHRRSWRRAQRQKSARRLRR
jgi:hypothetical protein